MTRGTHIGLSTLLLAGAALAATPKDARATFDRYVELWESYDLAVLDLYADDATVRVDRDGRVMELSSARWAAIVEMGMDAAKETEDISTYSRVRVKAEDDSFLVTAHRKSASKCVTDKTFYLRLEERGDALRIVEQFSTSSGLSHCTPDAELAALLERTRASIVGHLPLMLDEETRLEKVEVQGSALFYTSRLVNVHSTEFNLEQLRGLLAQTAVHDGCVGSGKALIDAGATFRQVVVTADEVTLAPIDVTPALCAMLVE